MYNLSIRASLLSMYDTPMFEWRPEIASPPWKGYIDYVSSLVVNQGTWLEFGVWSGLTATYLLTKCDKLYGFDSFHGLSEQWGELCPGFFRTTKIPSISGLEIVKGRFEDTLYTFLETYNQSPGLIHIDCDTYASSIYVLRALRELNLKDTIIAFDEVHGNAQSFSGEFQALIDSGLNFEWVAHCESAQAAIRII